MDRIFLKTKLAKILNARKDRGNFKTSHLSNDYEVIIFRKKQRIRFLIVFLQQKNLFLHNSNILEGEWCISY